MDPSKDQEEVKPKNKGGRPKKVERKERKTNYKRATKLDPLRLAVRRRAHKKLMADPAYRKMKRENMLKARAQRRVLSRVGVPDGWTYEQVEMQRVYDGLRVDLLLDRMIETGMINPTKPDDFERIVVEVHGKPVEVLVPITDEGRANAALREAMIGAVSPLTHSQGRINYIRTVLEWTKAKPAQTSNVNLNSEDWLDAALKDNGGYDATNPGDESAT